LDFAREFLPDEYGEVRHIFGRRGAYRREDAVVADALDFEQSTARKGVLQMWAVQNLEEN
jgi:hypothetical protein